MLQWLVADRVYSVRLLLISLLIKPCYSVRADMANSAARTCLRSRYRPTSLKFLVLAGPSNSSLRDSKSYLRKKRETRTPKLKSIFKDSVKIRAVKCNYVTATMTT